MTALVTPRKQPPIAIEFRPDRPERLSMTWLEFFQRCHHSALLHMRYGGGAGSHEMARGSVYHEVRHRCINECMENGEVTIPFDLAKAILFEVLRDPRFTVSADQWDYLRQCVYHFAKYTVLDLEKILAVEQLLVWDLGDWRISGKVDFAWLDGDTLGIQDDKTARWPQALDAFIESFQTKLYALMAVYGRPVTVDRCARCQGTGTARDTYTTTVEGAAAADKQIGYPAPKCSGCKGKGYTETVEDFALGESAQKFHMVESYPGVIWGKDTPTERIATREHTFTRADLVDEKSQVEALLAQVTAVFESGQWDAVPGDDQCSKCPARAACPLPAELLPLAGSIETEEEAEHYAMAQFFLEAEKKDVDKALKTYNKDAGKPIPLGDGYELDVAPEKSTSVERKQLAADISNGAAKPFEEYVATSFSNRFKRRKTGEAAALRAAKESFESGEEPASPTDPEERWGEQAPF